MHPKGRLIVYYLTQLLPQILLILVIFLSLGRNLLPNGNMFLFHDQTQYARIIEFSQALKQLHIPPISAQEFNFGIGYPIFLFYAPLAYWITSIFYLLGIGIIEVVKISFLLSMIVAALGMYSWLSSRYSKLASWMGALLFVSSPWFASEIFVRGNIATTWFLALAPWSLWALTKTKKYTVIKSLIICATLVTHNALSLLWIPVLLFYSVLEYHKHRRYRLFLVISSIIMTSFFWVPALLQLKYTYASEIARLTVYRDHFLCINQIWSTAYWGFGGSTKGCIADGMSFMLGKLQLILALMGIVIGPFFIKRRLGIFTDGLIVFVTIFLTTYDAQLLWAIFSPIQVVQFPWRLLSISLVFISALVAATFQSIIEESQIIAARDRLNINKPYKKFVRIITNLLPHMVTSRFRDAHIPSLHSIFIMSLCIVVLVGVSVSSTKFFFGKEISIDQMRRQFASIKYISHQAAYDVPEYVPKTVNYAYWQQFRSIEPNMTEITSLEKQFNKFQPNNNLQLAGTLLSIIALGFVIICLR